MTNALTSKPNVQGHQDEYLSKSQLQPLVQQSQEGNQPFLSPEYNDVHTNTPLPSKENQGSQIDKISIKYNINAKQSNEKANAQLIVKEEINCIGNGQFCQEKDYEFNNKLKGQILKINNTFSFPCEIHLKNNEEENSFYSRNGNQHSCDKIATTQLKSNLGEKKREDGWEEQHSPNHHIFLPGTLDNHSWVKKKNHNEDNFSDLERENMKQEEQMTVKESTSQNKKQVIYSSNPYSLINGKRNDAVQLRDISYSSSHPFQSGIQIQQNFQHEPTNKDSANNEREGYHPQCSKKLKTNSNSMPISEGTLPTNTPMSAQIQSQLTAHTNMQQNSSFLSTRAVESNNKIFTRSSSSCGVVRNDSIKRRGIGINNNQTENSNYNSISDEELHSPEPKVEQMDSSEQKKEKKGGTLKRKINNDKLKENANKEQDLVEELNEQKRQLIDQVGEDEMELIKRALSINRQNANKNIIKAFQKYVNETQKHCFEYKKQTSKDYYFKICQNEDIIKNEEPTPQELAQFFKKFNKFIQSKTYTNQHIKQIIQNRIYGDILFRDFLQNYSLIWLESAHAVNKDQYRIILDFYKFCCIQPQFLIFLNDSNCIQISSRCINGKNRSSFDFSSSKEKSQQSCTSEKESNDKEEEEDEQQLI